MDGPRIVELPSCKMVSSGISTEPDPFAEGGRLVRFNQWWMEQDRTRRDRFYPRDFMWQDRATRGLVWWYAVDEVPSDLGDFEVVDFEGGLYAAAVSRDADDEDGERVYNDIKAWIAASGCFEIDERENHYDMFQVITSPGAAQAMGYQQLEIFVPMKAKR